MAFSVQVSPERFRPNLVLSGAMQPYVEDTWQHLSIGTVPFRVTGPFLPSHPPLTVLLCTPWRLLDHTNLTLLKTCANSRMARCKCNS